MNVKPIDLTLTISKTIPTFPGSPKPQFISWSNIKNDGYNLELLFFSTHTGTHLDAPYHFVKNANAPHDHNNDQPDNRESNYKSFFHVFICLIEI